MRTIAAVMLALFAVMSTAKAESCPKFSPRSFASTLETFVESHFFLFEGQRAANAAKSMLGATSVTVYEHIVERDRMKHELDTLATLLRDGVDVTAAYSRAEIGYDAAKAKTESFIVVKDAEEIKNKRAWAIYLKARENFRTSKRVIIEELSAIDCLGQAVEELESRDEAVTAWCAVAGNDKITLCRARVN